MARELCSEGVDRQPARRLQVRVFQNPADPHFLLWAGYWENELLLIVEDPAIAGALESRIEELLARSPRVDRNDPGWRSLAKRREWMRRWPGVMSV